MIIYYYNCSMIIQARIARYKLIKPCYPMAGNTLFSGQGSDYFFFYDAIVTVRN